MNRFNHKATELRLVVSWSLWVIYHNNSKRCFWWARRLPQKLKGVVICQNTRDNVVPRMQQWPLDIPQWHITPHPQLSAKIIILYAFHTHRRINSKFPRHLWGSNSPFLSCGPLCCDTKGCVTVGIWRQLTSSILTVKAFSANTAHSPDVGLMSANIKTTLCQFLVGVVFGFSSVAYINAVKVYSIG